MSRAPPQCSMCAPLSLSRANIVYQLSVCTSKCDLSWMPTACTYLFNASCVHFWVWAVHLFECLLCLSASHAPLECQLYAPLNVSCALLEFQVCAPLSTSRLPLGWQLCARLSVSRAPLACRLGAPLSVSRAPLECHLCAPPSVSRAPLKCQLCASLSVNRNTSWMAGGCVQPQVWAVLPWASALAADHLYFAICVSVSQGKSCENGGEVCTVRKIC
jgi:hypothetical protein